MEAKAGSQMRAMEPRMVGGEGANSGEAGRVVLVGFVAEGIVVVDTGKTRESSAE